MATNSSQKIGCIKSLWQSFETPLESSQAAISTSSSFLTSSMESSCQSVNWMIENRGGLAKLVGLMMVPSQFLGPDLDRCQQIIDHACQNSCSYGHTINKIRLKHKDGVLKGVICYPPAWNSDDNSRCVVYHNPNGHKKKSTMV